MILYISIIIVSMFLICLFNTIFSSTALIELGVWKLVLWIAFGVLIVYIIDLIASAIVFILPTKIFDIFRKINKKERVFYEKLGIKKWKDLIPIGKGPIGIGMDKSKIQNSNDPVFISKLITECFKAEVMHFLSMFLGFLLIPIYPIEWVWSISIPIAIVNMVLQVMPFMVQRYNLPKLEVLLKRASRQSNNNK